jgi:dimethylargininase
MRIAITREISRAFERCELTHLARQPIDLAKARRQHEAYEKALAGAGCQVDRIGATDDMPDSVFIEDAAVVVDELAIVTRPGAESRRRETAAVAAALAPHRRLVMIESPGTLDGGDVLRVGTRVFVGESARTNAAAISQMTHHLAPLGYTVHAVPVEGCLHLKSAVSAISVDTLLFNPAWVRAGCFRPLNLVEVDPAEAYAANALLVGDAVIYPTAFPRTAARIRQYGGRVVELDVSELAKAEGAVTCCSLIFERR